jgi:polar amino acid transport system substrate-binding protein
MRPCLAFALLTMLGSVTWAQAPLQLAAVEGSATGRVATTVLERILRGTDIAFGVTPLPAGRATLQLIAGEVDGDVARIHDYGNSHAEMVRVEPAYLQLRTVVFARADFPLPVGGNLPLHSYKVGIVRGIQHAENATASVPDVTRVTRSTQLIAMLAADRFDLAVDAALNGAYAIRELKLPNVREVATLHRQDLYLYLHRRHANLAPQIGKNIQTARDNGNLAKWVKSAEETYLATAKPMSPP